jgi:hypothetical protein
MSVILFSKREVYQTMANAFEDLKNLILFNYELEDTFYKALRRIYFANVAAYLCQYHDDTPLTAEDWSRIDPFIDLRGVGNPTRPVMVALHDFFSSWGSIKYNCTTNDGELYRAKESYTFMENLAITLCELVLDSSTDQR